MTNGGIGMHRRNLLAVAVLPTVLAIGGCGGDDGAPSRKDYAQDADRVCSDVEDQLERINRTDPDSPDELAAELERIKTAVRKGLRRLRRLERPEGDAGETADQLVRQLDRELEGQAFPALDRLKAAARKRDPVARRAAARRLAALDDSRSDRLARKLGADECAED